MMTRYALIALTSLATVASASMVSAAAHATTNSNPTSTPVWAEQAPRAVGGRALAANHSLPADVLTFRARREQCEHFMGEDGYDKAREAYLNRKVRQFCTGTDKQLASLRKRYATRKDVIASLKNYEDEIE